MFSNLLKENGTFNTFEIEFLEKRRMMEKQLVKSQEYKDKHLGVDQSWMTEQEENNNKKIDASMQNLEES